MFGQKATKHAPAVSRISSLGRVLSKFSKIQRRKKAHVPKSLFLFSCNFKEVSESTYFTENLRVTGSENYARNVICGGSRAWNSCKTTKMKSFTTIVNVL